MGSTIKLGKMEGVLIALLALITQSTSYPRPGTLNIQSFLHEEDSNREQLTDFTGNYNYINQPKLYQENGERSAITYKPLERYTGQEGTPKAEQKYNISGIDIGSVNIYKLEEQISDNVRQILRKLNENIDEIEDELSEDSKIWEDKLDKEINRFEETLMGNQPMYFQELTDGDSQTNIDKTDSSPYWYGEGSKFEPNKSKSTIDPSIVFEYLGNSEATTEKRKRRIEREASYGNSGGWNRNYESSKHGQELGAEREMPGSSDDWRPKFPGYPKTNNGHSQADRRFNNEKPLKLIETGEFEEQTETDNSRHGKQTSNHQEARQREIASSSKEWRPKFPGYPKTNSDNAHANRGATSTSNMGFSGQEVQTGQKPMESDEFQEPTDTDYSQGQHQLDNIEFGQQIENIGQEQMDDTDFTEQKSNYQGTVRETDFDRKPNQRDIINEEDINLSELNGQREIDLIHTSQRDYEGQQQTDSVEFGGQRPMDITGFENPHDGQRPLDTEELDHSFKDRQHKQVDNGEPQKYDQHRGNSHSYGFSQHPIGLNSFREPPKIEHNGGDTAKPNSDDQSDRNFGQHQIDEEENTRHYDYTSSERLSGQQNSGETELNTRPQTVKVLFHSHSGQGQRNYGYSNRGTVFKFQRENGNQHHAETEQGHPDNQGPVSNKPGFTSNIQSSNQRGHTYLGNKHQQIEGINSESDRHTSVPQYEGQQPNYDLEFENQKGDASEPVGKIYPQRQKDYSTQQHSTTWSHYTRQPKISDTYERQSHYGSQQQTDYVNFEGQRPMEAQRPVGSRFISSQSRYESQHPTADVSFEEQKPLVSQQPRFSYSDSRNHFGSQHPTDISFDEPKTFTSQLSRHSDRHSHFGSQNPTDDASFEEQTSFSSQHSTGSSRLNRHNHYGSQQQMHDTNFEEQKPISGEHTISSEYGSQQPTDDVNFEGQRPYTNHQQIRVIGGYFGRPGQYESQKETDSVSFDSQKPHFGLQTGRGHSERQNHYGSQQQTDYVSFEGQSPYTSQQPTRNTPARQSHHQTDEVSFEGQTHYGSQQPIDESHHSSEEGQRPHGNTYQYSQPKPFESKQSSEQHHHQREAGRSTFGYHINNRNQGATWSVYQQMESKNFRNRDPMHSPSNLNPNLPSSESSFSNSYRHSFTTSSDYTPNTMSSHHSASAGGDSSSNGNHELNSSKYRLTIIQPSTTERTISSTRRVNQYQMIMKNLDAMEKDLIGHNEKTLIIPERQFQAEADPATFPTTGYMGHLTPQEPSPVRPHFEYNSDEEEDPTSFWSRLGSKMRNSYNKAKDKTKQIITDIKSSVS